MKFSLEYLLYKLFDENKDPLELRQAWVCKSALWWLDQNVRKSWDVLEFGAGGSTLFFSDNCNSVDTIETSKSWENKVKQKLVNQNVSFLKKVPNKKYDFILVDSSNDRLKEFEEAKKHLKRWGMIFFDNIDRYDLKEQPQILFWGYSIAKAGVTHSGVFL